MKEFLQKAKKAELPQERPEMNGIPKLASAEQRLVQEAVPRLSDSFRSGLLNGEISRYGGIEDNRVLRTNFEFALNGIIEKKQA